MGQGHPGRPNPSLPYSATPIVHRFMGVLVAASTGLEPASVATQFALQCSVFDYDATQEAPSTKILNLLKLGGTIFMFGKITFPNKQPTSQDQMLECANN